MLLGMLINALEMRWGLLARRENPTASQTNYERYRTSTCPKHYIVPHFFKNKSHLKMKIILVTITLLLFSVETRFIIFINNISRNDICHCHFIVYIHMYFGDNQFTHYSLG